MDFVVGLPRTQASYDAIWVTMDRLTKSVHFLAIRNNFSLDKLAKLYISEIVKLHGVSMSIMSDRDPRSHPNSGQNFRKLWVLPSTSAPFSTLRLMVNLKGTSKLWKICSRHVCWSLKTIG